MSTRRAATTVGATLSRHLQGGLVKTPPPSFYPLLAHPPAPSLVRAFPERDPADLPAVARRAAPSSSRSHPAPVSLHQQAKDKLDQGHRLTAQEDAALLDPSGRSSATPSSRRDTRRKPPRPANTKRPKPWQIVFPEDKIRLRFFQDHPFEAYRPTTLVEGEKVQEQPGPKGKDWTQLSQRSTVPSAEDCIAYILNLVQAHSLPLAQAYPHGLAQFRTLRSEHELASRSALLQAQSHGGLFFGEIDRVLAVEEKVLDEWTHAREIQNSFASARGGQAAAAVASQAVVSGEQGKWAPVETRPAHVLGTEDESLFSGGVEYLQAFAKQGELQSGAIREGDGKLVGVEA
ncbi:hypothetical protein JCM8097_009470 [Rhodosporidiobolus ruineniae]